MATGTADYTIVFAIDFSEMSDFVIQSAIAQAKIRERPAVHAVCVIDPTGNVLAHYDEDERTEYAVELAELEKVLRARMVAAFEAAGHPLDAPGDWTIATHTRVGSPAGEIAEVAREVKADLIIVGRHGHTEPGQFVIGSVPSRVMLFAACDVLVVQPTDYALQTE